jgi:hypothetical protein
MVSRITLKIKLCTISGCGSGTVVTLISIVSTATIAAGSTQWASEGSGPLKTAVVTSLAYRWSDNTLLVGTHGNGMFVAAIGSPITVATGITQPIRDDKNFIKNAFPTIVNDAITYQSGNLYTIKQVQVQVHNMSGQLIYNRSAAYGNGSVPMGNQPAGQYILTVTSNDRKYQFVKKFMKQ